jgi:glycosyltransferase involved in cell wall biosynthesis
MRVAIVHDYLTQFGGAERVVLSMLKAFPGVPVHTSLYEPSNTFIGFNDVDIRPLAVNRLRSLRTHHRRALPLLAPSFSHLQLDYDVVLCSSSGWAHGARTEGRKVVYCHSPARWLYQTGRYLGSERNLRATARGLALKGLRNPLADWDQRAVASADVFFANSTMVQSAIREIYHRDAEVLAPPPAIGPDGAWEPISDLDAGYFLCVSRLLPYKNVDSVIAAFEGRRAQLVIVGTGPDRKRLESMGLPNVRFLGSVDDAQLRWLYGNCQALVSASYEDYGLTPIEAAGFGKPSVVLRWGGFLDNIIDGETGVFFDEPTPHHVTRALDDFETERWVPAVMYALAARRSEARFVDRLREVVEHQAGVIRLPDVADRRRRVIRLPDEVTQSVR